MEQEEQNQEPTKQLLFQKHPYLHENVKGDEALLIQTHFSRVDGFFVPVLMGNPVMNTGSFADIYHNAFLSCQEEVTTKSLNILKTPIYPFKINALHYFVISANSQALEFCFKQGIKWMFDVFGNNPLNYALELGDRSVLEAVIQGLFIMDPKDRELAMRQLPLQTLLAYPGVFLAPLLAEAGQAEPLPIKMCNSIQIPSIFPMNKILFTEGTDPYYDLLVAEQLHPKENLKQNIRNRGVSTRVLNNPIPRNYTEEGLILLDLIDGCPNDDIVRSKPVLIYLNRKWNDFAFNFYIVQLYIFLTLIFSLSFIDSFKATSTDESNGIGFYILLVLAIICNTYFFLFEVVQLLIQKWSYFSTIQNIFDVIRVTFIFVLICSEIVPSLFESADNEVEATIYFLMWYKILNYLTVFKPTRYLIKMIFETVSDIKAFIVILFAAMLAYAQISYSLQKDNEDGSTFYGYFQDSYALGYGELGDYDELSFFMYMVFFVFSFFIPLVLLNMLIAIMGDSYSRVQTNSVAADARALAELEKEMEEILNYYYSFKPGSLDDSYYYCFYSKINDEQDGDGDWEGTVGQLKVVIQEQSDILEAKINQKIQESMKMINAGNLISENSFKGIQLAQTLIDDTMKRVTKESKALSFVVEEQVYNASQSVEKESKVMQQALDQSNESLLAACNTIITSLGGKGNFKGLKHSESQADLEAKQQKKLFDKLNSVQNSLNQLTSGNFKSKKTTDEEDEAAMQEKDQANQKVQQALKGFDGTLQDFQIIFIQCSMMKLGVEQMQLLKSVLEIVKGLSVPQKQETKVKARWI